MYQQPQPVEQQPVVEPEPVVEETKPTRPPLYYFEEVEEKRAREREQLAARYQPIPEPVKEPEPIKSSLKAPSVAAVPPVEAAAAVSPLASGVKSDTGDGAAATVAAPVFSLANSGGPRPQVKEGIGPQLPRPKRIRVPTRRELASYGIKLPSQRAAEEKPAKPSVISTILAISTTMMKSMRCSRMNWHVSSPRRSSNAMANSINMMCP